MSTVDETSAGVVALLLDDLAPPRLGTLLRGARKARGLTRRDVAQRVDTTTTDLRRYERGDEPVPPSLVAALAECYGEALTAQLAPRAPVQVDPDRLVVGDEVATLESADVDEVLGTYVELVARVRQSQPGEPIALRADDLVALSAALGRDADDVEARIVAVLGCTPREAHSLHMEMLRRKLVLPVAGLVTGLAIIGCIGIPAQANSSPGSPRPAVSAQQLDDLAPASNDIPAPTAAAPTPTTTPAPSPRSAPTTEPAAPTTTVAPTPEHASEPGDVTPAAEPATHPVVTPDTTPMSIPPHETVTIIQP